MRLQEWAGVTDYDPKTTLAIVFTDIIDSTTLYRSVGDAKMFDMLVRHFERARALSVLHHGFEIKLIGDAYMVVFRTADPALQFALDFVTNTGDPQIAVRVGIHVGPVRIKDDDIYGLQVNLAERLSHVEVLGQIGIFLSTSAKRDIESEHGAQKDFVIRSIATPPLKGFAGAGEQVFKVIAREIRGARFTRNKAQQEEARKNPKSTAALPPPEYNRLSVKLPDPPRFIEPESPTSDALGGILRRLTFPSPDEKK